MSNRSCAVLVFIYRDDGEHNNRACCDICDRTDDIPLGFHCPHYNHHEAVCTEHVAMKFNNTMHIPIATISRCKAECGESCERCMVSAYHKYLKLEGE